MKEPDELAAEHPSAVRDRTDHSSETAVVARLWTWGIVVGLLATAAIVIGLVWLRPVRGLEADVYHAGGAMTIHHPPVLERILSLALFRSLQQGGTDLCLQGTLIDDAWLARHESQLSEYPRLELLLAGTRITDEGLKTLGRLPQLVSLDLTGTQITDAGLHALIPLASPGGPFNLSVGRTRVTDRGLTALASFPFLHLGLDSTQASDAGLTILNSPLLKRLSVWDADDAAVSRLTALPQLSFLWLQGEGVSDASLKLLANANQFPSIRHLTLVDCGVSEQAVSTFKQAHPQVAFAQVDTPALESMRIFRMRQLREEYQTNKRWGDGN